MVRSPPSPIRLFGARPANHNPNLVLPQMYLRFPNKMTVLTLEVGRFLYHGTTTAYRFQMLKSPAWLTDNEHTAMWFAQDEVLAGKLSDKNARPIVKRFQLTQPVELLMIVQSKDDDDLDWVFHIADAIEIQAADPYDLAQYVCATGFDGWYVNRAYGLSNNIPNGADVMLCHPEDTLILAGDLQPTS